MIFWKLRNVTMTWSYAIYLTSIILSYVMRYYATMISGFLTRIRDQTITSIDDSFYITWSDSVCRTKKSIAQIFRRIPSEVLLQQHSTNPCACFLWCTGYRSSIQCSFRFVIPTFHRLPFNVWSKLSTYWGKTIAHNIFQSSNIFETAVHNLAANILRVLFFLSTVLLNNKIVA